MAKHPPKKTLDMAAHLDAAAATAQLKSLLGSEELAESVAPLLRAAFQSGKGAEDIYKLLEAVAAIKVGAVLLTETDSTKLLGAAKEVLDRSKGKAIERSEITHTLDKTPDEQLDALILSKLAASSDKVDEKH